MVKENTQKVIDDLELAYMSNKVDMSHLDHFSSYHASAIENVVEGLANLEQRDLTLYETILAIDDNVIDTEFGYPMNSGEQPELLTLAEFYKVWADFKGITQREDNVLNWTDDSSDWKIGYQKALANLIVSKGTPVKVVPSYYGWEDYDLLLDRREDKVSDKVVAVFNVKEDYWHEFNGTFNTDDDSRSGMVADVVYASGVSRRVRYEGNLREIMGNLGL